MGQRPTKKRDTHRAEKKYNMEASNAVHEALLASATGRILFNFLSR